MNPVVPALLAGVAVFCTGVAIARPPRPLRGVLEPYTAATRSRLGDRSAAVVLPDEPSGSVVRRVLGPMATSLARSLSRLQGEGDDQAITLALYRAGVRDVTPEVYRRQQLLYAVAGVVAGSLLGLLASVPLAVVLGGLGGFVGATRKRSELDRLTRLRRLRIRQELGPVCHVFAVLAQTADSLQQVTRMVVERIHGDVADELAYVLDLISAGATPDGAYLRMAELTPEPAAARLYSALATAVAAGGEIADALLAQAEDVRDASREARRAVATRKKFVLMVTTIVFMAPALLIYVAAPLPSIMFPN